MTAKPKLKPLSQQAIVITGATSGIGLSTARRAARQGACVFLIARGEEDLKKLTEELQGQGHRVAYAVADVGNYEALAEAADKCRLMFGGFDTWVNNAGISIFGSIREVTLEDQRRLFDTNYWGVVNGSLIAAEHLRNRPGGGALINVGSTLSDMPIPIQGVYAASKHAVKGFTNAFRIEMIRGKAPLIVTLVKPAAIDTPYNKHAKNLTGEAMQNPQPVYATHVVADTILWCAEHPIREITVGAGGRLIASFYAAMPWAAEPLMARFAPSLMRDRKTAYQPTDDGLYDPTEDGLDEEVYYPMVRQFSVLAEARKHPGVTTGALALVAVTAIATILLTRRTAPTRYEQIRRGADPRGWIDADALRHRFDDIARGLKGGADDLSHRTRRFSHDTRDRAGGLFRSAKSRFPAEEIAAGARRSGRYARDHAKQGGALLAVATIAAAVGAAALESRKPDSRLRSLTKH